MGSERESQDVLDFTVMEAFDRKELLAEAREIISCAEVKMGRGSGKEANSRSKEDALSVIDTLEREQAQFSPRLDVYELTGQRSVHDWANSEELLRQKTSENDFFLVRVPITLFPRSGWAFTRLECYIRFMPDHGSGVGAPIIHDIFPHDSWQDLLTINTTLHVSIGGSLRFECTPDVVDSEWSVGGARVVAKSASEFRFAPMTYTLRRPLVRARGRLNNEAFWRLDGKDCVDSEDVILQVVLMVPKSLRRAARAEGALRAYHDFQHWTADLFRDWRQSFSQALMSFFSSGATVDAWMKWDDFLPTEV